MAKSPVLSRTFLALVLYGISCINCPGLQAGDFESQLIGMNYQPGNKLIVS